jgi:hypothetical protein
MTKPDREPAAPPPQIEDAWQKALQDFRASFQAAKTHEEPAVSESAGLRPDADAVEIRRRIFYELGRHALSSGDLDPLAAAVEMWLATTDRIDATLLARARELLDAIDPTVTPDADVVNEGLRALIARESAKRLLARGGTMPDLEPVVRRRPRPARTRPKQGHVRRRRA